MKMKKFIVAIIASSVVLTGCSSADNSVDLNVSEFSAKSQEPGVISLDVRTAGEFAEGHLVNAININVESENFEAEIESLDKNATYAVYCRSGRRSAVAVDLMKKAGFTNLYNLDGGLIDWSASGLPLVK
jgi:rhodanese-related sulfurtransferase